MKRRNALFLMVFLAVLGVSVALYKVFVIGLPATPSQKEAVWMVDARLSFQPTQGPVEASLAIPGPGSRFKLVKENPVPSTYDFQSSRIGGRQHAVFSKSEAKGLQNLYYRVIAMDNPSEQASRDFQKPTSLAPNRFSETESVAAQAILDAAKLESLGRVGLAAAVVQQLNAQHLGANARLLLGEKPDMQRRISMAVAILAKAHVCARQVNGLILQQEVKSTSLIPWLQVWNGKSWIFMDPHSGEIGNPERFFVWSVGSGPLQHVIGGKDAKLTFSITHQVHDAVNLVAEKTEANQSKLMALSLLNLPVQAQAFCKQLLVIPVGLFVTLVLRLLFGVRTLGVFMPVLIEPALHETQLGWGICFFSLVVLMGIGVRRYLQRFDLPAAPCLSVVMIFVVVAMTMLSLLSYHLGIEQGLSLALFPMAVLTMTIDRTSAVLEEQGAQEAFIQSAGSLLAAVLAYFAMTTSALSHLTFIFPELLMVLIAVILMVGRYEGIFLPASWRQPVVT